MGKGDRKTAKGKRFNSSYGNLRPRVTASAATAAPVLKKPATKAVTSGKSAAATKTTAKKVVKKAAA